MQEENVVNPAREPEMNASSPEQKSPRKGKTTWNEKTFRMFNTVTNVILLAGLVVLYVLFFTEGKKVTSSDLPAQQDASRGTVQVVFVNIDTLNERYEFIKKLRSDLEGLGKRLQDEVLSEQSKFERDAADFQRQVAGNAITEERAKAVYEELMERQQRLLEKKDRYTQLVADKELNMNLTLLDSVTGFLKRYNRQYHYDYILGYKGGGEILLANDTLDITNEVINSLNLEYRQKEKK
jgi:outer membrane protein